jgi:hypothetical protein
MPGMPGGDVEKNRSGDEVKSHHASGVTCQERGVRGRAVMIGRMVVVPGVDGRACFEIYDGSDFDNRGYQPRGVHLKAEDYNYGTAVYVFEPGGV